VVRVISLILLMLAGCAETSYRSSNPSIPDAANLLREGGKAYARGDCKNAVELFSSLLEIVPEDVDTMLKIARCSYLLGNSESALAQYRAVLRIDPKSRSAHYNILFIQLESLVETSSAVIENAPPKRDDEEALLAVAKGIISSVTNPRDVANPAALSTAASSGSVDADPVDPESLAPTPAELSKVTISGSVDADPVDPESLAPTPAELSKVTITGSVDADPVEPESLAPTPAELSKVTISGSVDADPVDPESLAPTPAELSKVTISGSVDAGPLEPESLSPPSLASMSDAMAAKNPGEWFVNIGAYASELSAENWSLRLQNSGYDAVVEDVRTAEGKMLKRVRLTGFDSEEAAQSVAIELEADYGTGPLWVGQVTK
jgi:cell division septation protein DedD